VDHGAQLARDLLADLPGVTAGALAVEIRLEPMADGLVQENAAVAGREHDGHVAGRRLFGVEHRDGSARRFARVPLGRLALEVAHAHPPPPARRAALALALALGDGAD